MLTDIAGRSVRELSQVCSTASRGETGVQVSAHHPDLVYKVATNLEEAIQAWEFVYERYLASGLVDANPARLHTLPRIVGSQSLVVAGRVQSQVVTAISAYTDSEAGLPLDDAYPEELAGLRRRGRQLAEIGLLVDRRREERASSMNGLFELMRFGVLYAMYQDADDVVIGVHPRHTAFYQRLIGFEPLSEPRTYATVNEAPVVLMRLDWRTALEQPRLPKGLKYFLDHPVPSGAFDARYRFAKDEIVQSRLELFLSWWKRRNVGILPWEGAAPESVVGKPPMSTSMGSQKLAS